MAIEVSAPHGAVLAIDEPKIGRGESMAKGAEHAGFADARLSGEKRAGASMHRLGEILDERLFGRWEPELGVADVFGEGLGGEAEVGEVV